MTEMWLIAAIIIQVAGHMFKAGRWKQIIRGYEEADDMCLLKAIAVGQGFNLLLPYRVGDLIKIQMLGKKLKNGYILAAASVITDIFIDTITVGAAFGSLHLLGIHRDEIGHITLSYMVLSVIAAIVWGGCVWKKRNVKLFIQRVSNIFNPKIEQQILLTSYTVLENLKSAFNRKNVIRIISCSGGVWGCYFLSYEFFAHFLQAKGYGFTLTSVFRIIFSMAGDALFMEFIRVHYELTWIAWFILYLVMPLVIVFILVSGCESLFGRKKETNAGSHIIPQMSEADRTAFLSLYFNGNNQDYFQCYLSINRGVSVLCDCSAGSNATTILCMEEGKSFYRKYALGEEAKRLWEQVEWIEKYRDQLPLPVVIRRENTEKYCYYDMLYCKNSISFFQYIHTSSIEDSWNVLEQVMETLREKFYIHKTNKEMDIDEYVDQKVWKNVNLCESWILKNYEGLYKYSNIYINGKEYPNLKYYKSVLDTEKLKRIFADDKESEIHGDLTVENIICTQGGTQNWYLIDPNPGSAYKTSAMDYGKLLQSLHGGYEFLMMVKEVKVSGNRIEFLFAGSAAYEKLYEKYEDYLLKHFSLSEVKSIYLHEAVHWLRLMPYKIRKNPESAVIFYAGMLMILSDIEEKFLNGEAKKVNGI